MLSWHVLGNVCPQLHCCRRTVYADTGLESSLRLCRAAGLQELLQGFSSSISEEIQLTGLWLVLLGDCPRHGTHGKEAGAGGASEHDAVIVASLMLLHTCTSGAR